MTITAIFLVAGLITVLGVTIYFTTHVSFTRNQWVIILVSAAVAVVASLLIGHTRIAGTIESTTYGWPHFFLQYARRDIVDNQLIKQWSLATNGWYYLVADYLFYLSIIFFLAVAVKVFKTKKHIFTKIFIIIIIAITATFVGLRSWQIKNCPEVYGGMPGPGTNTTYHVSPWCSGYSQPLPS